MTAYKGPGASAGMSAGQQQPQPKWERTPWWHWRKVLLRQSWRIWLHRGVSWNPRRTGGRGYAYETDRQRALASLDKMCNPDTHYEDCAQGALPSGRKARK